MDCSKKSSKNRFLKSFFSATQNIENEGEYNLIVIVSARG